MHTTAVEPYSHLTALFFFVYVGKNAALRSGYVKATSPIGNEAIGTFACGRLWMPPANFVVAATLHLDGRQAGLASRAPLYVAMVAWSHYQVLIAWQNKTCHLKPGYTRICERL